MSDTRKMLDIACHALAEKKAIDLKALDIHQQSVICDYFAIASAANPNQMMAMADAVMEDMHKAGYHCRQMEGKAGSSWLLLDFQDVIVHIFSEEDRQFYHLERVWSDASFVDLGEI